MRYRTGFKSTVRSLLVCALASLSLLLVTACGASAPAATAKPADVLPANTGPSAADLGGGSPTAFAKVFTDATAGSKARAASAYADAAKPRPAGQKLKVGFIFVGSQADLGYNQAAYEGSQWLERAQPDVQVLRAENIPETAEVQRVAEQMITQGASIIFATSYGYSGPIKQIASKYPGVVFLHQGDLETRENYGAFFGNIWQLEYAAGQVAGKMTKTNKLGFIAAFPIPQTLLNVNAYHLGARSVNPKVETTFVLTSDWCDPAKQTTAVRTMVDSGIDVFTEHQDCTKTIVEAAERSPNTFVTGYHQDASSAAPRAWLTGAAWNWGPIYSQLVGEIKAGTYKTSVIFGGLDAGFVKLAPLGKSVPPEVQAATLATVEGLRNGTIKPFTGPLKDQKGAVRITSGVVPPDAELQTIDWLLEGITGSLK
ncbi:MAG: BMP family ABC transporter substrate-binding protein [Dehalococcoidia bacterium]|nr:BMP family ABC transporter substrate-binding protein [Dehalococcoidia bacterium]MSQ17641.1 BMP family ABC transporter substrate-binding protein [Dehalococcoidia bacterium]